MIEFIGDHLAVIMFMVLTIIMFVGYPIAFVLGAVGIVFGFLGILFDIFSPLQFANLLPRIYGQAVENQVLVAVPMFIFMGTVLEKSGVAEELLHCLQVLLRREERSGPLVHGGLGNEGAYQGHRALVQRAGGVAGGVALDAPVSRIRRRAGDAR